MLDVLVRRMQQEIANIAARLPLIAKLVLQARVSKRSVEQIAQFEVVLVTPVDRGCLWAAEPRADCGGESDSKNKCRYVLRSRCYMCLCLKDRKRMPRRSNTSPDLLRSSACRNATQSGRWKCREILERHDANTVHESDRVQKKTSTHRIGACGGKAGSGVQTTSAREGVLHSENL